MDPAVVELHYTRIDLLSAIREGLTRAGRDLGHLTVADLAPVDEFHIRGRQATLEPARLV